MADKPVLSTISGGAIYTATKLNTILDQLADAVEGCLGRGGTSESPNSMQGDLDMNTYEINNLGTPTAPTDAATKAYVDSAATNIDIDTATAADLLTAIKTVDGAGSGLDADKLDGNEAVVTATADTVALRANDGDLYAVDFHGNLIGNVTGNLTGDVTGDVTGNADTATTATTATSVPVRGALAYATAPQDITTAVTTVLDFPFEVYDTDSVHSTSTNTSRLTVPSGVSKVKIIANITWNTAHTSGVRASWMLKNGTATTLNHVGYSLSPASGPGMPAANNMQSSILTVTPGDYFEVVVRHNHGSDAQVLGSWFSMEIIE